MAALRVFARHGLAGTKISDIAKAAGLSHGLVYHYFESKEAVFVALVVDAMERARLLVERVVRMRGTPLVKLRAYIEGWLEISRREPEVLLVILQGLASENIPPDLMSEMAKFEGDCVLPILAIIERGQRDGAFVETISGRELVATLMAMLHGLTVFQLMVARAPRFPQREPPPEIQTATVLRLFTREGPS